MAEIVLERVSKFFSGGVKAVDDVSLEIADGVVLWLCTPAYIRDVAVPAIRRGRTRAGKSLAGFEIVAAVPVALTGMPVVRPSSWASRIDVSGATSTRPPDRRNTSNTPSQS